MSGLEASRRVHELCRRFERMWRDGGRPVPADFVAEAPAELRAALAEELRALVAELEGEAGGPPPGATPVTPAFRRVRAGGGEDGPPRRLAGCDVVGVLGRGGMGVVYKGWQRELKRFVALKVIRDARLAGPEDLLRFRREAEAAARLAHEHIVRIHGVGEHEGLPVLCLEYVSGGSLAEHLRGRPQAAEAAARLVETLARAMEHAHRQGVIHRDLKPANVLLRPPDGAAADAPSPWHVCSPMVSDFGLARSLGSDAGLTGGRVAGTPSYMAPEQAGGRSAEIGPATDVYALGAILYEMLTGGPPFRGEDVAQTLTQVLMADPVPPSRLRPVPADLETICLKCLGKEPGGRYSSAAALADDLRAYQEGRPIRARPTPWWEHLTRAARRHPLVAALILVAAGGLAGGAGLAAWQAGRAEQARGLAVRERARAEARQARLEVDLALGLCEAGEVRQGLAGLARGLLIAEGAGADELVRPIRVNLASWRTQLARPAGTRGHAGRVMATAPWELILGERLGKPQLRTLAVCPRTGRLATGGEMALVQMWGRAGGPLHAPLPADAWFGLSWMTVLSLAFSPDGGTLAAGNTGGEIHRWSVATGRALPGPIRHGTLDIWALAFSPDGRLLASGGGDGRVALWDAATGEAARPRIDTGAKSPVHALAFDPKGTTLASGTRNGWVHLWDVAAGRARTPPVQVPGGGAHTLAISPDGGTLLVGGARSARFYELPGLTPLEPALGHLARVDGAAFSPDGGVAVTADHDGWVRFWRTATREPLGETLRLPTRVNETAFLPGSRQVAVAAHRGEASLWEAPEDRAVGTPRDHRQPVHGFQILADGRVLSVSGNRLLLGRGDEVRRLPASRRGPRRAASLSGDGRWLASCIWNRSEVEVHPADDPADPLLLPHDQPVTRVEHVGGRLLTLTADDATRPFGLTCWDPGAAAKRRYFVPGATCFAVSPDGRRLAVGGKGRVWVCRLETGEAEGPESAYPDTVRAVAWSADGGRVVAGCGDGTIRVSPVGGGPGGPAFAHRAWVRSAAFSPDGNVVLAGSADGAARFWDWRTGVPLGPPLRHGAAVNQVGFAGGEAVTCSDNGLVQRWRPPEPPLEGPPDAAGDG